MAVVGFAAVFGCGDNTGAQSGISDAGPVPEPVIDCVGLACPPCATGSQCPQEGGAAIGDTCCAAGDNLVKVGTGTGSEVVDLETDGTYVFLCGGFGVTISDVSDPKQPRHIANAASRCQRIGIGPLLPSGARVFYLAHHGDSWVATPFVRTYHLSPEGSVTMVAELTDASISFEGLQWHDGYLYVAAHTGGVRVYETDAAGAPSLVTTLDGFTNAWKLAVQGRYLYVADAAAGLKVVSIADPRAPVIVHSVTTTGLARDVDVHGDRVYVATGGTGVDVFDATNPAMMVPVGSIDTLGSAQGVVANDRILAVANWSNVSIYDVDTLALIGTEAVEGTPSFEQDLGIAMIGDHLLVGEWEGLHVLRYRQGYVAPDAWVEEQLLAFSPGQPGARAVVIRNRGPLELVVHSVSVDEQAYSVDKTSLRVPPGQGGVVELTYQPPGPADELGTLTLDSNDPDFQGAGMRIPLITTDDNFLNVGDKLTPKFGFLDPSNDVNALEGKVVVLAYFALF